MATQSPKEVPAVVVIAQMTNKVREIDWRQAAADVERFLDAVQRQSLQVWIADFFSGKIDQPTMQ